MLLSGLAFLFLLSRSPAQTIYNVIDVSYVGGGAQESFAFDVADCGWTVADYLDNQLPVNRFSYVWNGLLPPSVNFTLLNLPATPERGRGIAPYQNSHVAAGYYIPGFPSLNETGFFWRPGLAAHVYQVGAPPQRTRTFGVNAVGYATGTYFPVNGSRAFRYSLATQAQESFDPLPGFFSSGANHINAFSTIAGYSAQLSGLTQATYWVPAFPSPRALPSLDPTLNAEALGINRQGRMAGYSEVNVAGFNAPRAVRWTSQSTAENLGVLPGDDSSVATAISSSLRAVDDQDPSDTQVIGYSYTFPNSTAGRAFLWEEVNGMRDLNVLSDFTGTVIQVLYTAEGINDLGEICGTGRDAQGFNHAFVLRPKTVDPPRLGRLQAPFASTQTSMHALGFTPGVNATLAWHIRTGNATTPACSSQLGLDTGYTTLPAVTADANGRVSFYFTVPAIGLNQTIYIQAFQDAPPNCKVSNLITETIQ